MSTQTTPTAKCGNVKPASLKHEDGTPRRDAVCVECGGYLSVLTSGLFRRHKPVFKPGDPRIEANLNNPAL